MGFLALFIRVIGYALYVYCSLIAIYFLLGWISEIRGTKFYRIFYRIVYPFERIFGGKLIIGMFDLGSTLGLIMLVVIARAIIMLSYYI